MKYFIFLLAHLFLINPVFSNEKLLRAEVHYLNFFMTSRTIVDIPSVRSQPRIHTKIRDEKQVVTLHKNINSLDWEQGSFNVEHIDTRLVIDFLSEDNRLVTYFASNWYLYKLESDMSVTTRAKIDDEFKAVFSLNFTID